MPRHDPLAVLDRYVRKLKGLKRIRDHRGDGLDEYREWVATTAGPGLTRRVDGLNLDTVFMGHFRRPPAGDVPWFSPVQWFDEATALFALRPGWSTPVMHLVWRDGDEYYDRKLSEDECAELQLRCRNVFIQRFKIVWKGFDPQPGKG